MAHVLPELPYTVGSLEPHISKETLVIHYGRHHQAYLTKLNAAIENTDLADMSLEDTIKSTAGDVAKAGIFNNAAQVWNHSFYWNCMRLGGGGKPRGKVLSEIESSFGSFDRFAEDFKNAAATQFGSGWAWLIKDKGTGKLKITKTLNADTPIAHDQIPLLTIDVWEHAYYLDYQNKRPDYIEAFMDKLVNWDFVDKNLK